ncbi:MAG: hypothetical protein CCU27_17100 [Nitrospira sp. UW-LDO-02]|nr:MAG: hypothetical protein CCU27_17100 [Nitrospira sp. UW-LDO-02]
MCTSTEFSALTRRSPFLHLRDLLSSGLRGGSGWLDSVGPFLSGAWRIVDYAAVCRVVRWS